MVQPSSFLLLLAFSAVMAHGLPLDRRDDTNADASKLQTTCDPKTGANCGNSEFNFQQGIQKAPTTTPQTPTCPGATNPQGTGGGAKPGVGATFQQSGGYPAADDSGDDGEGEFQRGSGPGNFGQGGRGATLQEGEGDGEADGFQAGIASQQGPAMNVT